eukprot:4451352-Pleurochrysis_carterae.AAC.1
MKIVLRTVADNVCLTSCRDTTDPRFPVAANAVASADCSSERSPPLAEEVEACRGPVYFVP